MDSLGFLSSRMALELNEPLQGYFSFVMFVWGLEAWALLCAGKLQGPGIYHRATWRSGVLLTRSRTVVNPLIRPPSRVSQARNGSQVELYNSAIRTPHLQDMEPLGFSSMLRTEPGCVAAAAFLKDIKP